MVKMKKERKEKLIAAGWSVMNWKEFMSYLAYNSRDMTKEEQRVWNKMEDAMSEIVYIKKDDETSG